MACRKGLARVASVEVAASTTLTVVQLIAAANHAVKLTNLSVYVEDADDPTAKPLQVDITRQTDAGTMSSLTPVKLDDSVADTLDTTAQHTATAEPTGGDAGPTYSCFDQVGLNTPLDYVVGAADRVGVVVTNQHTVARNVTVSLEFEE